MDLSPALRILRDPVLVMPVLLLAAGCDTAGPEGFPPPEPVTLDTEGLRPLPDFEDNPLTRQGIDLGRRLFHDPILSGDRSQSCASCHDQAHAFSDPRRFSVGIDGTEGERNAPPLFNLAWSPSFFWAGRAASLEDQAREPVPNPIEMNLPWEEAVARLAAHPEYPERFGRAFGTIEIDPDRVVRAIAQFERTLLSRDSRYDRHLRGEISLTEAESRGEVLFFGETVGCFRCHGTILFTDHEFHDNGLDLVPVDPGRQAVTGEESDRGKFRSPALRNVEYTAPYMHDGRFVTLEEVMDHYSSGVQPSPNLDPILAGAGPPGLPLTDADEADLVAFLKTLSDPGFLANPDFGPL